MTDVARVLVASDDPGFAGAVVRALVRIGAAAGTASLSGPPDPSAELVLLDASPATLPAAIRWLRARPGRYAAAVGDRLGRDAVRGLYADGLVRYLRRSASPERIAACLWGDAPRALRLERQAAQAEAQRRRPGWRRAVGRAFETIVPRGPERGGRVAAFATLSVVAGFGLAALLQTAGEATATVERLERRIEELQRETSAARDLRPAGPPASPPWSAPDPGTRRPD